MNSLDLHATQISILRTLRHAEQARYSELMRPLNIESDSFKFHIRKLLKHGMIEKNDAGKYQLTISGKVFANSLDKNSKTFRRQPKVSLLMVVQSTNDEGQHVYLVQRRLRNPHWGFQGFLSGPLLWGDDAAAAADNELHKQSSLTANFETSGFIRQRDYRTFSSDVLEDVLFQIMVATVPYQDLDNSYTRGQNSWMNYEQLASAPNIFELTTKVIDTLKTRTTYLEIDINRDPADF